ncbi:MAG: hypothetical protein WB780_15505 [Candidatus Acidiferrales bacterium]
MTEHANSPLTYPGKPDWGSKPFLRVYSKFYGLVVFIVICGYLWKFQRQHKPVVGQVSVAALGLILAVSLVADLVMKTDRSRAFFLWYQIVFILAMTIYLFVW